MAVTNDGITLLIQAARDGRAGARDELFTLIYAELRRIAARVRASSGHGDTLPPTALANETFLHLERRFPPPPVSQPESRATFFQSVAYAMREIMRDHVRADRAQKRGCGRSLVSLTSDATICTPAHAAAAIAPEQADAVDLAELDDALTRLESFNQRWFAVVSFRYLASRPLDETARLLNVGVGTVKSDWTLARAWLRREIDGRDRP